MDLTKPIRVTDLSWILYHGGEQTPQESVIRQVSSETIYCGDLFEDSSCARTEDGSHSDACS